MLSRGQTYPLLLAGALSLALLVITLSQTPPLSRRPQPRPYYLRVQELRQITEEVTQEQKFWEESSVTEETEHFRTTPEKTVTPRKSQCHPIQKVGFAKTEHTLRTHYVPNTHFVL